MTLKVDTQSSARVRFLDATLGFHRVVDPAFAVTPSFVVRRDAPKGGVR